MANCDEPDFNHPHCSTFVTEFVEKFEYKLESYRNEVAKRIEPKRNETLEGVLGFAFPKIQGLARFMTFRPKKLEAARKAFYDFKENPQNLRRLLVEAGVCIFYTYQQPFDGIISKKGLHKLEIYAENAAKRIMEGVFEEKYYFGEKIQISKEFLCCCMSRNLGFFFSFEEGFGKLNRKSGVIVIENGKAVHYAKKTGKNNAFRYQFEGEDQKNMDKYTKVREEDFIKYSFTAIENEIFNKITSMDSMQNCNISTENIEQTIKSVLTEELRNFQGPAENSNTTHSIFVGVEDPVGNFTGRANHLIKLHEILCVSDDPQNSRVAAIVSISGLGGVGKTELAKMYVHTYKEFFNNNIVWLNAETPQSLTYSFYALARKLSVEVEIKGHEKITRNERAIEDILHDIYEKIKFKCLFIFDNAEKPKDLEKFLPKETYPDFVKPSILITSRYRKWTVMRSKVETVDLEEFSENEGMEFVSAELKGCTEEDAKELCIKLQYLPLALAQAVAYIRAECEDRQEFGNGCYGIRDYLRDYEDNNGILLNSPKNLYATEGHDTIRSTFMITVSKLRGIKSESSVLSLRLLEIMAFLSPDHIDYKTCFQESFLKEKNTKLLKQAIRHLKDYSLINIQEGIISIHRLVQAAIRLDLQDRYEEVLRHCMDGIVTDDQWFGWYGKIDANNKMSVYKYACKSPNLIKHFKEQRYFDLPYQAFMLLAEGKYNEDQSDLLRYLLDNELVEVNFLNVYKEDTLTVAASRGRTKIVEVLLKYGANNVDVALHHAEERKHLETAEVLRCHIASLNKI